MTSSFHGSSSWNSLWHDLSTTRSSASDGPAACTLAPTDLPSLNAVRDLLDAMASLILAVHEDGTVHSAYAPAHSPLAALAAEAPGRPVGDLCGEPWGERFRAALAANLRGQHAEHEATVDINGETLFFETHATPWMVDGQCQGSIMMVRNITARMHAMDELRRLKAAVQSADESIMVTDAKGVIVYVNPCFERMAGYTRSETVGHTPALLESGCHSKAFYDDLWAAISSGKTWRGRFINRRKDGTLFEEQAVISPVFNGEGTIVNYVAVKRDVTRQMELETQLRQSQKMEAIGRLAGGVAHDFTNILVTILGNAKLARDVLPKDAPAQELLAEVVEGANRASLLTSELLAFAHKKPMSLRVMDLNRAITGVESMLSRTMGGDIEVHIKPAKTKLPVKIDPSHIEQIVIHLAVNARDAMESGGLFSIETHAITFAPEELTQLQHPPGNPDTEGASFAVISFSDTGVGMPEEVRQHVFEPFFTTKASARSTGLGLSTVYGIVKQHRGHISVYSDPGQGSSFKIYLPLVEEPEIGADEPLPHGTETVLLVEDEHVVRGMLVGMLHQLGYQVLEARNGPQALRMIRESKEPFDVLLTDVRMPTMSGKDLARELLQQHPGKPVVYASAYPACHLVHRGIVEESDVVIQKPLSRASVARTLRDILDAATRA